MTNIDSFRKPINQSSYAVSNPLYYAVSNPVYMGSSYCLREKSNDFSCSIKILLSCKNNIRKSFFYIK